MDPTTARHLGSGVCLSSLADGSLLVRSERQPLPWSVRAGRATGTTVMVGDEAYEVVARSRSGSTESWTLQPWPQNETMRVVCTLDEAWVSDLGRERKAERRASQLRLVLLPIAPMLGSVPASLQSSWELRWGFPAAAASMMSAVGELAVGTVGIVHALSSALFGSGVLPQSLGWLGLVGPILAVEAVVRLKHVAAVGEPIGAALLLPLAVLARKDEVPSPSFAPVLRHHDLDHGRLQLLSPIYRADWTLGGLLTYRGERFELTSVKGEGREWIYTFVQADSEARGETLRLGPLPSRRTPMVRERPPGALRTTLVTALACLAPRDLQEAWARTIDAPAVLLTVLGAGAELLGGLVNIGAVADSGGPISILLNSFFMVEGAARLGILITSGRPAGSLLGLALRPALQHLMME